MPLYMDTHRNVADLTKEAVEGAHQARAFAHPVGREVKLATDRAVANVLRPFQYALGREARLQCASQGLAEFRSMAVAEPDRVCAGERRHGGSLPVVPVRVAVR